MNISYVMYSVSGAFRRSARKRAGLSAALLLHYPASFAGTEDNRIYNSAFHPAPPIDPPSDLFFFHPSLRSSCSRVPLPAAFSSLFC